MPTWEKGNRCERVNRRAEKTFPKAGRLCKRECVRCQGASLHLSATVKTDAPLKHKQKFAPQNGLASKRWNSMDDVKWQTAVTKIRDTSSGEEQGDQEQRDTTSPQISHIDNYQTQAACSYYQDLK